MIVVFTNGCFDLIHAGHVSLLREARALGGLLIVGLDTDSSVVACKGPNRPVNNYADRYSVLSELKSVHEIVPFDGERGLHQLLRELKPDIIVKGNDYDLDTTPEFQLVKEWGGRVHIVGKCGLSTSSLIAKIRGIL